MLRSFHINPKISADKYLKGLYDYNSVPMAPPGTKVLVYETPSASRHRRMVCRYRGTALPLLSCLHPSNTGNANRSYGGVLSTQLCDAQTLFLRCCNSCHEHPCTHIGNPRTYRTVCKVRVRRVRSYQTAVKNIHNSNTAKANHEDSRTFEGEPE